MYDRTQQLPGLQHRVRSSSHVRQWTVLAASAQAQAQAARLRVTVGVISPYSRQVALLRRRVEDHGLLVGGTGHDAQQLGVSAEVATVDSFQVRHIGTHL